VVSECAVWVAAADGAKVYTEVSWARPAALIVGSEAHGAGDQARSLAEGRISIPISPLVDSLNAAVAGAVILFEAVRQRSLLGADAA